MNLRSASAPRARPWSIWGAALTLGLWVWAAPGQADEVVVERVGQWPSWPRGEEAYGVAVSGHYAYLAQWYEGLQVIDVSDPANPRRVGGYDTPGGAWGVAVSGQHAYVADGLAGLQVIDVSDPAKPRWVGGYDTSGNAYRVAVSGNYAYVADLDAGLQVIDVSDPANLRRVGGYDPSGASGVAISGHYAYVAALDAGLQVLDVSDPANPRRVGGYDTSGRADDVAVSGHYAYVADAWGGLQVIDVSDPANPRWVGGYDITGRAYNVAVSGNYAYVAVTGWHVNRPSALQVIDVSNPANPRRVGGYEYGYTDIGEVGGVAVSGQYIYLAVADWPVGEWSGLQIFRLSVPGAPPPTLAGVRARQRPGTTLVEVDYELGPATGQTATVSVAFSRNDGASFDIVPAANTLSGDVGSGVQPGTRRLTWDAGRSLPAGTFGVNFVARVTAETWGGTARGTSSRFALEVPAAAGGGLQLSGRVLDAATRNPISGAAVSLAGQNTTTVANGAFAFASVSLASGNTLRISKAGYATYTDTVPVPPGATAVTVPDILLQVLPADGRPVVTSLKLRTGGVFLGNVPFANEAVAVVNWNGSPAGSVQFYANGVLLQEVPGAGPSYSCPVNMGSAFRPSFNAGDNSLRVIARTASGVFSDPASVKVTVWPLPGWLEWLPSHLDWLYLYDPLKAGFMIPPQPLGDKVYVPRLGYVGAVFGLRGDVEYYYRSGEWRLYLGAGYEEKVGKPGARPDLPGITMQPETAFYLGNQVVKGRFQLGAHGYFGSTSQRLLAPDILGKFELYWRGELTRYGVLDVFPGLTAIASKFPGAADALKPVSVILYGKLDVEGDVVVTLEPETRFKSFRIEPKIGLEFAYELKRPIELRVYGGGDGSLVLKAPGTFFDSAKIRLYIGAYAKAWVFIFGPYEYVFLDWTFYNSNPALADKFVAFEPGGLVALKVASGVRTLPFGVLNRNHLLSGPERFVAADAAVKAPGGFTVAVSALEAFRLIGRPAASPVSDKEGMYQPQNGPVHDAGPQVDQADLPLLENVFPGADPAMAARAQELMLLYVTDNGSPNDLQFTDIRWTRWDGTNWSAPATIHTNTQAEFAPQVAYDGNGDAIAVWERVADPNFNETNLTAMAAQMEIVWSKWNRTNGQWSVPQPLTANNHLDHAPLVCGPMTGGKVLAVWTANTANLLMGTNGAGSQVWWAEWNPVSQSWSSPQMLLADLPNRLSQSLSGVSNLAVYAWTRDMDGVLTNATDQQVFYCTWSNGTWSTATQLTSGSEGNRNARVAVSTKSAGISNEGFESGDFTRLPWSFSGNAPWTVQSSTVRSGSYAAASGAITHNQTSGMLLHLNCEAGTISFAYSVSSESGWDFLRFYIDGVQKGAWSGSVGWTTASYPVTAGPHTFEWRYTKDESVSSGSDKAWVDDITLPAASGQQVCFVWQQGTNLVLSQNFSTNSTLVRADSQTAGFADYALTIGPAGNLAVLWQEMSQAGSDAHYRVLDPNSASWSRDAQLFDDPPLERSFAPVWDDVGNLTVAYNKVQIIHTNKTVELEGGGTVTITNVPQPSRVDLCVTKRRVIKDVGLAAGDFTVSADNYLPGAAVTLSATVRNLGDLAVSNAVVAFYDGNPTNGGVLITNVPISGWFEGAATNAVSALWVVPEPATNHVLYAVVDPDGVITEFDEANNTLSVRMGGTDLAVSLVSQSAETNGALRVIAQVQNLGAPRATNSVLAIRREGQTNAPLATVAVPALEPGRLAQVALDLPAGTQPEGEAIYRLFADETGVVADVDTNNNTTAFAVNLWLDADGDGMPDGYEKQYSFLDPNNPNDASLDYDGDGMSNLAEYLAGTAPDDPLSYLRIKAITVRGTNGVEIVWGSAANKLYTVQRAGGLWPGAFTNLAQNLLSTPPENVYLDTTATNAAHLFYRVKLETGYGVDPLLDTDRDGMPDGYEKQYSFLDPNNPNDASLDYDGDGMSNLAEYRAGTAPDDPLSYLRITAVTVRGTNGVEIAWGSAANKFYTVQRAGGLWPGAFTNLAQRLLSTPPENVYLDTTATNAAHLFYRIKVE